MNYTEIRETSKLYASMAFNQPSAMGQGPYVWGLRDWFNQNFDLSKGVMDFFQGNARLENEDFQTYKDRLWVQKQLIRFSK
jgi:hypothetical protein